MNENFSNKTVARFILESLKNYKLGVFVMFFVAVFWAIDLSVRPYIMKIIIDRISNYSNQPIFEYVGIPTLIYFLMAFGLNTVFRVYNYFISIKMVPNMRKDIANKSFGSLLDQSYTYYQNNFAGSLSNKVNDLKNSVPEIIQIAIDRFLSHILALSIAIYTLWQVNYIFALFMLIWSTIFALGSFLLMAKIANLSDIWSDFNSTITGKIVDSLSNILSVRLFANSKEEVRLISNTLDKAAFAEQKLEWTYFWIWFSYGYSWIILQGISLYMLLIGRQNGTISVGDFVLVLSLNYAIIDFLWQLTKDFSQFTMLWGKIIQALRTILATPDIQDKPHAKKLVVKKGEIIFDDVCFHYKGTNPLFQNKTIKIEAGGKVGLVGYSGSGKSTFVNLLLRLYEVNSGAILIDGQDISNVTQNSLHEAIAMIPQEPSLFNRTIMENIRYSNKSATDKEVILAARKAHADKFISNLPQGYDSNAGERGVKLSGGQRQRIAIARAILKNAPILILDEATSQLDSITENEIQESMAELMQNKTALVIAHRLSTLQNMDRILVFEGGAIIEDGSHEELLKREGQYKRLWDAQVGGLLPDKKEDY